MFAKIKHLAIISDNYVLLSRFYEALFGMKTSKSPRPESAVAIGDGYIGMNIIPQKLGRQAGLEHFGLEVEDVEKVGARLREKYPAIQLVKRPTNRPFAGISTHDPDGYVFDLSQQAMTNRAEVYVEGEWKQDRYISHFVLRSLNPANLAKFYREVYELQELEKPADDPNHYLIGRARDDGYSPWAISDYEGAGIEPRHMDHLGFKVEDVETFKKDLRHWSTEIPPFHPNPAAPKATSGSSCWRSASTASFSSPIPTACPSTSRLVVNILALAIAH